MTADKGYYLAPYARLLLAVAAMRDKNNAKTQELLVALCAEFPDNGVLTKELGRVTKLQNHL